MTKQIRNRKSQFGAGLSWLGAGLLTPPIRRPKVSGSSGDLRSRAVRGRETRAQLLRTAFCVVALILFQGVCLAQSVPVPAEMLADAELTAVTFVNADRGWAVGDRGAIWHTADGGRSWKLQPSGVSSRLEAVQFLDADNGYAVGGWTQPYTHETHGVVLRTRDGGRTWQNTPDLTLPGLTHARFFDIKTGWAIGNASPLFPSCVFRTNDGGRSWSPVPKGESAGWVTGDFRDMRGGAVAGLGGTLGVVMQNEIRPSRSPNLGPRYVRRMLLSSPIAGTKLGPEVSESTEDIPGASLLPANGAIGWLVGDGGLVLTTNDGGNNWTLPPAPLPAVAADNLDCRALALYGNHVWIAGAPGTFVLHSPDGGQSWETYRTGQTLPLRSLWFIDEYRGWAAGSLGTILHTRDGGQTWRVQRSGGSRVSLLGIFSEPDRIPLELIALQSGSDAYLSTVEVIGRRDLNSAPTTDELTASERTHAAVIAAGGSQAETAWRFPLAEPGLPQSTASALARWNQVNNGQATQRLEEHLVRCIRQWRPEVIVTEDVSPRGDDPLAHLTNQLTLAAVQKAAEATAYPEQLKSAGLEIWQAKKVLTLLPDGKQGTINITPAQWSPRLGRSLADVAQGSRGLISSEVGGAPRNIGLSLLVDHLPQETGRRDVMSGIQLSPGGEARRQLANPPPGDLEQLSRLAQKRHNIEQLLARIDGGGTNLGNWLGQIDDLTRGLGDRQSGELLWQLAERYVSAGRSASAAEALHLLLDKHPRHPLADRAATWLVQYYASHEIAWRHRQPAKYGVRLASAVSGQTPASLAPTSADEWNPVERAGKALAVAQLVERTRPMQYADPAFGFPLAVAMRHAGQPQDADKFFHGLNGRGLTNPWAVNAAAEQWLLASKVPPPKRLLSVVKLNEKPKLDGRLDDAAWQVAKSVSLQGHAGEPTSAAVLAYDDDFLYFSASCQRAAGVDYPADDRPRVPDEDLSPVDHLTLLLDVDRDYATYWRFAVDARGRPAESCHGDATWNPEWYIAAGGDERWWTIEAAIPLSELGPKPPQVRDVWTVNIQRTIPRVGLQSFSQPAAIRVRPEGFGLMVFE